MPKCTSLLAKGGFTVGPLITHTAALEDAPPLCRLMAESPANCLAMVIDWRAEP